MLELNDIETLAVDDDGVLVRVRAASVNASRRTLNGTAPYVQPMTGKPIHVTDGDFDKVVKENPYVVVDFWAEWCAPCRAIAPLVEELARKYEGTVTFAKLNSDENPKKVQEFMVMGIPTLLFFKGGKLVDQVIGAMPRGPFEERVKKHLA